MRKYIPLDTVVVEIDKRKNICEKIALDLRTQENKDYYQGKKEAYSEMSEFINALEVKEVDYDKEVTEFLNNFENANIGHRLSLRRCANHFFELGLKASSPLTWKDMMIIHKCIKDAMNYHLYAFQSADGQQNVYEEVLKRFKAQKG